MLERQRAQFHRQQQGVVAGKGPDVVGGARDPGGARDAPQAEDGRALDRWAHPQPVDDGGIDTGSGNSRHSDKKEMVDVGGRQPRLGQCAAHRRRADLDGRLAPRLVGFIFAHRQGQMASADPHRAMELVQPPGVAVFAGPVLAQRRGQNLLLEVIGRQGEPDRADFGIECGAGCHAGISLMIQVHSMTSSPDGGSYRPHVALPEQFSSITIVGLQMTRVNPSPGKAPGRQALNSPARGTLLPIRPVVRWFPRARACRGPRPSRSIYL